MSDRSHIRVLQIVGGMNRGGVETWLMHVLRRLDRDRFQTDFLVHTDAPCAFDAEIRALGSDVIPCLTPSEPWAYRRMLRTILSERGPYDVVHSHVHHYSGWVLRVADHMGIPVRIAHSHNDTASLNAGASLRRRLYLGLMGRWIAEHATHGLAASRRAATALFGARWKGDRRYRVLPYALDLEPFRGAADHGEVRAALGLPADAFVVGHVARFDPQKNHRFLAEICAEIAHREPRFRLVLVGDGPLQPAIRARMHALGFADRVLFLGVRADVAELMRAAFDVFLFPSVHEGLGIVLVEAQAAGLPCVVTRSLPDEADVVPGLVTRVSLDETPSVWADEVFATRGRVFDRGAALALIEKSAFNIAHGLAALEDVYAAGLRPRVARPIESPSWTASRVAQ